MITKSLFGSVCGQEIYEYILSDSDLKVGILTYGATIHNIFFNETDCILGYDDIEGYVGGDSYQGATVGRFANRIDRGKFSLNNKEYQLDVNNGPNHLHGGFCGFSHRVFNAMIIDDNSVKFSIASPDGEGGFPGNVSLSVTFKVLNNNLSIEYHADTDADTIFNFTNHAYFTLGAKTNSNIMLQINAEKFTPVNDSLIPTGELASVSNTPFDFRVAKPIGKDIEADHPQIKLGNGYDHNFVLSCDRSFKTDAVSAYNPENGFKLTCSSDMPGVQLYAAGCLNEAKGKNNQPLIKFGAFCLETQLFPDSPNHANFPNCICRSGESFDSKTVFSFSK